MGKKNILTQGVLTQLMDWAYNRAVSGFVGVDSAYTLGDSYLAGDGSLDDKVNSLIRWQVAKSATSGFVTGFGGLMTIPFTIPANIASVIYIQVRMITAIAYMGGYDIQNDKVKSLCFICMAGNSAKEFLKDISVKAGERLIVNIVQNASLQMAEGVGQKVGTKLLAKLGAKGTGKIIPVVGGVISASFDAAATKAVGVAAKNIFINHNLQDIEIEESKNVGKK